MLAGLAGVAGGPVRAVEPGRRSAAELMDVLMWNREPVGGPFALVDQTGRPRTDADFRGTLLLVYFGFTSCPDVCPTDLAEIGRLLDLLGDRGASIQPLFITLDPERDTVAHLAAYVPSFHPRLIALTGSAEAVRNIADAYKVYHERVQLGGSDYTVDHSAFIYLMDRSGGYLGFFPPGTTAERMSAIVEPLLTTPSSDRSRRDRRP
ncbi:SCO family protein [Methylobacterium sp. CB376]|uniref:SCO family protein n=1 Tax=Methylobacterium sp. CB376 TaxID=3138063 RepID=UPI001F2D3421|nr:MULTISPECIES: SCO family protein [Methylobacterium]WFT83692.1 SCO family protein [Methylobacterium nodulans]